MNEILLNYRPVNPTTWAYLSSLLMIALYFKFNRVFSIRNSDLLGLISLAPALLMIQYGQQHPESVAERKPSCLSRSSATLRCTSPWPHSTV